MTKVFICCTITPYTFKPTRNERGMKNGDDNGKIH